MCKPDASAEFMASRGWSGSQGATSNHSLVLGFCKQKKKKAVSMPLRVMEQHYEQDLL